MNIFWKLVQCGLLLLSSLNAFAETKADIYFNSCRTSSMAVLTNIAKDSKSKYKELDGFSLQKCSKLKSIYDSMDTWDSIKDPKFEGCARGVDAAIGMSQTDDDLRKKFKADLCL